MLALFAVVFIDELGSGVAPASAGDVARDMLVPAGLAAGGIITAFHALAIFVETPLLAWSERVSVRRFSSAALFVLALSCLGAALAQGPMAFLLCLALYGPASGCALSAAEGLLVESRPQERERTIARLTFAGALGDLAVPALLAALACLGAGWRCALAIVGALAALLMCVHASSRALDRPPPGGDEGEDNDEEHSGVLDALRFAFSQRVLLLWSGAVALTSLLDEVLVAFAVIHLEHASPLERAIAVGTWTLGFMPGLALLERYTDRMDTRRALLLTSLSAAVSLVALALTSSIVIACLALFVLGASTSVLYPLSSARAYAALPGRPALVNAVAAAFAPFDALAPLALGALALGFGAQAAILTLLIAPAGIGFAAWRSRRLS